MKLNVKRGIANGIPFCTVTAISDDGKVSPADSTLSRKLTGTTSEYDSGIFRGEDEEIQFSYGRSTKNFSFAPLHFDTDSLEQIQSRIRHRIETVRKWVEHVDRSEELEFTI